MLGSVLNFGWSNIFAKHILMIHDLQKFCSFDFGKSVNKELFCQSGPLDYLSLFKHIDIPITYYISLQDNLCRPDDIMIQYNRLRSLSPSLAHVKLFDGYSHIDFTYLNHHSMITEIMKTLNGKDDHDMHDVIYID